MDPCLKVGLVMVAAFVLLLIAVLVWDRDARRKLR